MKDVLIADDEFGEPGPVDIIIGTGELPSILLPQIIQGPKGTPAIHNYDEVWRSDVRYD